MVHKLVATIRPAVPPLALPGGCTRDQMDAIAARANATPTELVTLSVQIVFFLESGVAISCLTSES